MAYQLPLNSFLRSEVAAATQTRTRTQTWTKTAQVQSICRRHRRQQRTPSHQHPNFHRLGVRRRRSQLVLHRRPCRRQRLRHPLLQQLRPRLVRRAHPASHLLHGSPFLRRMHSPLMGKIDPRKRRPSLTSCLPSSHQRRPAGSGSNVCTHSRVLCPQSRPRHPPKAATRSCKKRR